MIESLFFISQMGYLLNTNIRDSVPCVIFANLLSCIINIRLLCSEQWHILSAKQL